MSEEIRGGEGEVDLVMRMVRGRYGDGLSEEQLDDVREAFVKMGSVSDDLRSVGLDNGEMPFVVPPYRRVRQDDGGNV